MSNNNYIIYYDEKDLRSSKDGYFYAGILDSYEEAEEMRNNYSGYCFIYDLTEDEAKFIQKYFALTYDEVTEELSQKYDSIVAGKHKWI